MYMRHLTTNYAVVNKTPIMYLGLEGYFYGQDNQHYNNQQ